MKEHFVYLSPNPYSCPGSALVAPRGIVVHYVDNPGSSALANRDWFENLKHGTPNPRTGRPDYGSAHDIVGLAGEVVHCVPLSQRAYHCGATRPHAPASTQYYTDLARSRWPEHTLDHLHRSPNAILLGIEYCHPSVSGEPDPSTLDSLVAVLADWCRRFALDPLADLFRHQDIVGYKECPAWYCRQPGAWRELCQAVKGAMAAQGGME